MSLRWAPAIAGIPPIPRALVARTRGHGTDTGTARGCRAGQQPHTREEPQSGHTHGSYGRSRRQGGQNTPRTPQVTLEPGWGLPPAPEGQLLLGEWGCAGKMHHPHLRLALGTAWPSQGASAALCAPHRHHGSVMPSAAPGGCASTKGSCAEELILPAAPRPAPGSTAASAPRPSTGADPNAAGEGASCSPQLAPTPSVIVTALRNNPDPSLEPGTGATAPGTEPC